MAESASTSTNISRRPPPIYQVSHIAPRSTLIPPTPPGSGSAPNLLGDERAACFLLASRYGQLRSCFLTPAKVSLYSCWGPGWRACSSFLLAGAFCPEEPRFFFSRLLCVVVGI